VLIIFGDEKRFFIERRKLGKEFKDAKLNLESYYRISCSIKYYQK